MPSILNDVRLWPDAVREAIRKFGTNAVWDAGLLSNGYPAIWIDSYTELVKLNRVLEREMR